MNLSRKRLKQLLKYKNKLQSRKKLKKHKKNKKSDTFRKKIKNLRTSSLRKYRKNKVAKYKRKAYLRGGAKKNIYLNKYNDIIKSLDSADQDISLEEDKYYNFDFIFNKDDDITQKIIEQDELVEQFHTSAGITEEEKEEKEEKELVDKAIKEAEKAEEAKKHSGDINEITEDEIEKSKNTGKSKVIVVGDDYGIPVAFTDNTNDQISMDKWFEQISNTISAF